MIRAEAKKALCSLMHVWRKEAGYDELSESQLSSGEFMGWVRDNYPHYLKFRSSTTVEYDVELWFDREFKQAWAR
jgi:hypothetical protein